MLQKNWIIKIVKCTKDYSNAVYFSVMEFVLPSVWRVLNLPKYGSANANCLFLPVKNYSKCVDACS